jgi:hypothetical protein
MNAEDPDGPSVSVVMSGDSYHEAVDPWVRRAFKRDGVLREQGYMREQLFAKGRAKENYLTTAKGCYVTDLMVKPSGRLMVHWGCATDLCLGNVLEPLPELPEEFHIYDGMCIKQMEPEHIKYFRDTAKAYACTRKRGK